MTAWFWPLPIAVLSQLQKIRLTSPFSYRFVITRPVNEFNLLPSDLVFCAIPFDVSCYKKVTSCQGPYETVHIMSLTSEAPPDINYSSAVAPVDQKTPQPSELDSTNDMNELECDSFPAPPDMSWARQYFHFSLVRNFCTSHLQHRKDYVTISSISYWLAKVWITKGHVWFYPGSHSTLNQWSPNLW